jgi:hypothetical protein
MNELQKLLIKYPDKPWKWYQVSRNPNITLSFIEKNPDKPWKWSWISFNKFEK